MSLCLVSGSLVAALPLTAFTPAWTHSIEKTRWEEDWQVRGRSLVLAEARIRSSGAGMEIPAGATLRQGVWHYVPALPTQAVLRLRHSPYAAAYELCDDAGCKPLADRLPGIDDNVGDDVIIELKPCP